LFRIGRRLDIWLPGCHRKIRRPRNRKALTAFRVIQTPASRPNNPIGVSYTPDESVPMLSATVKIANVNITLIQTQSRIIVLPEFSLTQSQQSRETLPRIDNAYFNGE
jgi:hypothetical protein